MGKFLKQEADIVERDAGEESEYGSRDSGSRGRSPSRGRRGMVSLEFALMVPFLLLFFAFAWDVIFIFNYEILGSYAAFAAARSYAVFQDEALASDVAVAVMSSATIPMIWEDDIKEHGTEFVVHGVDNLKNWLENTNFDVLKDAGGDKAKKKDEKESNIASRVLDPFGVARRRTTVVVTEHNLEDIYLRDGYFYPEGNETVEVEVEKKGFWQKVKKIVVFWDKSKDTKEKTKVKIGQVEVIYKFPILMGYLRKPSFWLPKDKVKDLPYHIDIYNTCACPVVAVTEAPEAEKPIEHTANVVSKEEREELARLAKAIDVSLLDFYTYIARVLDVL